MIYSFLLISVAWFLTDLTWNLSQVEPRLPNFEAEFNVVEASWILTDDVVDVLIANDLLQFGRKDVRPIVVMVVASLIVQTLAGKFVPKAESWLDPKVHQVVVNHYWECALPTKVLRGVEVDNAFFADESAELWI